VNGNGCELHGLIPGKYTPSDAGESVYAGDYS
jgi:hypothetical protein